jgi:glycosyltransferase involved in cell wall biosynthesis
MDKLIKRANRLASESAKPIYPIPKRIAYVVSHGQSYASNGYAIRTHTIASTLNHQGLEALCFVRPGRPWELESVSDDIQPEVELDGVRYIYSRWSEVPSNKLERLERSVERFLELFRVYRPSAVLAASNYIVGLPAWVAAKRLGIPFHYEVRGFWELSRAAADPSYENCDDFNAERERDTFLAQQAGMVFTLNQPMKDELVKRGVAGCKIELVPNGLAAQPEIKPASVDLQKKLGISPKDKVIGYIGSFTAYEGLDLLLDACRQLIKQGESVKLLLVGDDQPVTLTSSWVKQFADQPWLIQVGRVPHEQIAVYYALIDVVVIPRKKLPVCELVPPFKIVEALAYGKRLVVSALTPLAEYTQTYDNVETYEAGQVEGAVNAIQRSLELLTPAGKEEECESANRQCFEPVTSMLMFNKIEPIVRAIKREVSLPKSMSVLASAVRLAAIQSPKAVAPKRSASALGARPGIGEFHLSTSVELPARSSPICYDILVQPGQRLMMRVATEFRNIKEKDWRKAVLLLTGFDSKGEIVDTSFQGVSISSYFGSHFKYLPDTDAALRELCSLIVPEGVYQIQLGLCCFMKKQREELFVNELSVQVVKGTSSEKSALNGDGKLLYSIASKSFNNEGRLKDPLQVMEGLQRRGGIYGKSQLNLLKKLQGFSRLQGGVQVPLRRPAIARSTQPKHLLYCLHQSVPHTTNGYSTRSHGVAVGLQQSGFNVRVATRLGFPWDAGISGLHENYDEVELEGVTYVAADGAWLADSALDEYFRSAADHFENEARKFGAEVIVAASNHITALPALIAARRLGLPFVYEVRGLWEVTQGSIQPHWAGSERYNLMRELEQQAVLEADLVITLTEELVDEIASWGVAHEQINLVPNAVDVERFQPMAADAITAKELNLKPGVPVIGYAGSVVAYEGLGLLMEALAKLKQRGQAFAFVLVGDGKVIEAVKAKAKKLGLEGECRFAGRVPFQEVPRYLSCMDIMPIPRLSSAVTEMVSALKPLEAMAMGKAVVLSDVSPHIIMAGKNGERARLFTKDSAEALFEALQTLINGPEERKRLGQAARDWALNQRNWKRVTNLYSQSIEAVILDSVEVKKSISNRLLVNKKPDENPSALSILDEISEECWKYEFKQCLISRDKYEEQVRASKADFCFVESCWKGNRGAWQYAFTSPGLKHQNSKALLNLLPKVKEKMPVLFWNKEDPMHYDKFLPIAKYADVIFTTDSNKVSDYKRDVPSAGVYAVPFAAQQNICNPAGRFCSEPESVCFAGSYYSLGHEERKQQMHALLPSVIEFKGAIYDRFSKLDDERYKFPEEFQPYIRDAVPFDEVVEVYKRFKVFLNVNTIVDSPTMMSRRVYELLACGTPVVSTPSRAIEEQFSGIVHMAKDAQEANIIIEKLLSDDHYWDKTSHLGYREVMKKHTYAHRYQEIRKSLGYEANLTDAFVSIVTCTKRPHMIERLVENVARQNHKNLELILWVQDFSPEDVENLKSLLHSKVKNAQRVEIVEDSSDKTLGQRFNAAAGLAQGDYIAKMDDDDFYFEHYLSDMLIPFSFGNYAMVGKREVFMYLSGSKKLIRRFPGQRHMEVNFVAGPTFLIKKSVFDEIGFESRNTGEDSSFLKSVVEMKYKIYAADPFNFIQYRASKGGHTWGEDDEYFISNPQVKVEANEFNTRLLQF